MTELIAELENVLLNANLTQEEKDRVAELLYDLKTMVSDYLILQRWFNDYDAMVTLIHDHREWQKNRR